MLFTHDTEVALAAAAALVNTMPGSVPGDRDPDRLTSLDELAALYRDQGWTGRFDRDAVELEAVRALRPGCAASGSSTRPPSSTSSTSCSPRPAPSPSSSTTTASAGTSTRHRPTPRSPVGWR